MLTLAGAAQSVDSSQVLDTPHKLLQQQDTPDCDTELRNKNKLKILCHLMFLHEGQNNVQNGDIKV